MPWSIKKRDGEHCVIKYDGTVEKCYANRSAAQAYMRALYASEEEGKEMHKEQVGILTMMDNGLSEIIQEARDNIKALFNKARPLKDGRPSSSYLVVGDPQKTSTWHLPVKDAGGKPNHRLMGGAWAALHGGYRGNKYQGPNKSEAIAKLRALYKREGMTPPGIKSTFSIFKSADGAYRWFAIFTNRYRDKDIPPEILTEAAHLDFVKAVNDKSWPYPELRIWHIPDSCWGVSDLVAYDKESGFTIAAGTVNKGKESIAEATLKLTDVAVSHGMPVKQISRDADDNSLLIRYRSEEISPLPRHAAANKLTEFELLGGTHMELEPKEAEAKLVEMFGEEEAENIKGVLSLKGQKAVEDNLEFKDKEEEKEDKAESKAEDKAESKPESDTETPLTRKEVNDVITSVLEKAVVPLADAIKVLTSEHADLKSELEAYKTEVAETIKAEKEKAEINAWTPALAMADIINKSIVGEEKVKVDGCTKEAQGPKETSPLPSVLASGDLMDSVFSNIVSGGAAEILNPQ